MKYFFLLFIIGSINYVKGGHTNGGGLEWYSARRDPSLRQLRIGMANLLPHRSELEIPQRRVASVGSKDVSVRFGGSLISSVLQSIFEAVIHVLSQKEVFDVLTNIAALMSLGLATAGAAASIVYIGSNIFKFSKLGLSKATKLFG